MSPRGATFPVVLLLAFAGCTALGAPRSAASALTVTETAATIVIRRGDAHVLTYHKAEVGPPAGTPAVYRRSAFIHPLTAPNGDVVSGMHPKDHHHHLGLWHAWVRTVHAGRAIDFWNLGKGEGTVRYAGTQRLRRSPTSVGFTVTQHHVVLPDEIVLEEALSVDVTVHADGHYLIDYTTEQVNVTAATLELPAYRYGGCIAYRGPHHWQKDNSAYLTSEGRGRSDGHTTRARWCMMSGQTAHGRAAVAILGDPQNHDAPQRQRIWPATAANGGAMFFNFVPIQETGWALEPGVPATMRYRIVVAAGTPDRDRVDAWFREYVGQ